jgi:hypothetical protein
VGAAEYTVRELPRAVVSLAVGDILGQSKTEVVLSDGKGLALYRWEAEAMAWKWNEDGPSGRRVLWLDAGDIDGDGKAEVLVATALRGSVRTEVRSWRGGTLETVAAADGIYLKTARRGDGVILLGQRAGVGEVLAGRLEEYRWRAGAVERVDGTALPREAGFFGSAVVGEGAGAAVLALDRSGHLQSLARDGTRLWRSARPYGGYPVAASARDLLVVGAVGDAGFEEEARAFQGRLLAERAAGGGGLRVIVPRNFNAGGVVLTRHRELGQGEIVVLEGTPADLAEVAVSRAFDGYIADVARTDVDRDGRPEHLFVVNHSSGFLGERGTLVVWREADH